MTDDDRGPASDDSEHSGSSDGRGSAESEVCLARRDALRATGGAALGIGVSGVNLGWGAFGRPAVGKPSLTGRAGRDVRSGDWTQQTKLVADDGDSGDQFGESVAVNGSTALVGAEDDEDPNGEGPGSAYVFEESGGTWTQQAKLTADDGDSGDSFGSSVAVSGSTAVVGANLDETPEGEDAGSAYVFKQSGGTWTRQTKLLADDGDSQDRFGYSVAVDGSTAIVGAVGDENPNADRAGSAYVFEESKEGWTQQAKLVADDGDSYDRFGWSVAVDGSTVVVGAPDDEDPNGARAGSAYVFEKSGEAWTQQVKLVADDGETGDKFGRSVAVDGPTTIVGASLNGDPNGFHAGSAYIFSESKGSWIRQATLVANDGDILDNFGFSVAVGGSTAVVSAYTDEDPNGESGGSAYVFRESGGIWTQQAKLAADDGDSDDLFGASVAVDGSTVVVGAEDDEDPNGEDAGSAYVFTGDEGSPPEDDDGLARFDRNDDGRIDLTEVLAAITAFNTGGTVGGEPVTLNQVLRVITAFDAGQSV